MTVSIITAAAAGGKTTYAIERARAAAAGLVAEVRVCVPTALQAAAFRRRLAAAGGAMGVHVFTYDALVGACLNAARMPYVEISPHVQFELLRSMETLRELSFYGPISDKPGFISQLQILIEDLKNAQVRTDQFAAAITDMGDEPRLRDLATIYTAYQSLMNERGRADRVGKSWLAAEALGRDDKGACRDWPLLIIDGFDDFEPVQLALLKALATRVQELVILLPAAATVAYQRYTKTVSDVEEALVTSAKSLGSISTTKDERRPALAHLERVVFTTGAAANQLSGGVVTLLEAPQPADEVRESLRWLKQLIITENWNPEETALLARDLDPFRPFIQQIAAEFGLPVQLVDGARLIENPLIDALLGFLRLWMPEGDDDEPSLLRRAVVNVWRSPYFGWDAIAPTIQLEDADRLDTLARKKRVISGLSQWNEAFPLPATRAGHDAAAWGAAEQSGAALSVDLSDSELVALQWAQFIKVCRPPEDARRVSEHAHWLENLIGDDRSFGDPDSDVVTLHVVRRVKEGQPARAAADLAALLRLKEVLRGMVLAELEVAKPQKVSYKAFVSELLSAIQQVRYELPPETQTPGIVVTTAVNARGVSYRAVAVMGMNEGVFPRSLKEDPMLRESDRIRLRERGLLLDSSIESAEREFFYDVATRPRSALLLTRSTQDEAGAEQQPSIFWNDVRTRFIDECVQPVEARHPASAAELMLARARDGYEPRNMAEDPAWANVVAGARIAAARQQSGEMSGDGDLSRVSAQLGEMYPSDHPWSPSNLETYQACGYYYFTKHVIRLEPREQPEVGLDVAQLGLLYHRIFQEVYERGVPADADEATIASHVQRCSLAIFRDAPTSLGFQPAPWWGATQREIVERVTESVIRLGEGAYAFEAAEKWFGKDRDELNDSPPLAVSLGDGRVLYFRGVVDRIDRHLSDGTLRIIDYKLGGKSGYSKTMAEKGRRLQLQIYVKAAEEALGNGRVSEAFYWHFSKPEQGSFVLSRDEKSRAMTEQAFVFAAAAVDRIRQGRFAPMPPEEGCPGYCPAATFCAHYAPKFS